jgi:hypothetical protein
MKPPDLQAAIVAHLRGANAPVSGQDLAARFLRIQGADEPTCHRLLAPILTQVPGVRHRLGSGWIFEAPAGLTEAASPAAAPERAPEADRQGGAGLLDFVALAAEGVGPGGSGALRALSFVPVVAGEELQQENLPACDLDGDEVASFGPGDRAAAMSGLNASHLEALLEAVGDLPIVAHRVSREVDPIRRAAAETGLSFHPMAISAARLGHLLLGLKANHPAADLAKALHAEVRGPDDCRGRALLVARSFLKMIPLLHARGIGTFDALREFQEMPAAPIDLTGRAFTAEDLKALPAGPGVYRFVDRDGQVIYVGKSKNLRGRIGSYFTPGARGTAKGQAILDATHRFEYETVASELEAILLEAALLAEHRPRLNRQFEVHERPAPYGPRLNLVVVLRDNGTALPSCTLHLLKGGFYLKRIPGLRSAGAGVPEAGSGDAWREAAVSLRAAYFDRDGGPGPSSGLDWQLVGSFLRRFRDEINVLDVDESGDDREALDRLRTLVAATLATRGRTLAR